MNTYEHYEPTIDWVKIIKAEWQAAGLMPADTPEWRAKLAAPAGYLAPDIGAEVRAQRMDLFKDLCPLEFQQKIDRTLIPNLPAWDKADLWQGAHPGLWIWSTATGEAKTRMLWRKYGELHVKGGKTCMRVSGTNLAEQYHDDYNQSRTGKFYRDITGFDVVMLDDLDKVPLPDVGDSFAASANAKRNGLMLRELFDHFYEEHTPVLVTANEPIAYFAQRIGPSAERRMRAVCGEIEF